MTPLPSRFTTSNVGGFAVVAGFVSVCVVFVVEGFAVSRPSEYWLRYGVGTRVNSDRADTIQRRHEFFAVKMHEVLLPQMKDPTRMFGMLERELIYYRDSKRCAVCNADVIWPEAEIHHVDQHRRGGKTILANGALVHRHCHPKGETAEAAFAKKWGERLASMPSDERADAPANEERAKQIEALAKLLVKAKPGTTIERAKQLVAENLYAAEAEEEEENGEEV